MTSLVLRLTVLASAASLALLVAVHVLGGAWPAEEIAFDAPAAQGRGLFLLDLERGRVARLARGGRGAAWSADGTQVAYVGSDETGEAVYLLRPGERPRRIMPVRVQGEARALDWSPDGRSLVITDLNGAVQSVFMVDLATGARRPLTEATGSAYAPAWSSGGLIAFSWSAVSNTEIYTLPASLFAPIDSPRIVPRPQRITSNPYTDTAAEWSPDGRWLAFVSDRAAGSNLYLVRADGRDLHPVLLTPTYEGDPSWSPDGQRLALVSSAWGDRSLAVMNIDGTGYHPLHARPGAARPAWRP